MKELGPFYNLSKFRRYQMIIASKKQKSQKNTQNLKFSTEDPTLKISFHNWLTH